MIRLFSLLLFFLLAPLWIPIALANQAEIVSLSGKGAHKNPDQRWNKSKVNDLVDAGGYVRTFSASTMGVLLPNRTQLKLNQNSQMQIKTEGEADDWKNAQIKLESGRAWSNARPIKGEEPEKAGDLPAITMETPSATLSIRGTVWEVAVDDNGNTQLTVLSGSVEMGNELGSIMVRSGEEGEVRQGKAPIKRVISNPENRVQWVNSWSVDPSRWARPDFLSKRTDLLGLMETQEYELAIPMLEAELDQDPNARIVYADLLIYLGRAQESMALLQRDISASANARALYGRAAFRLEQLELAAQLATAVDIAEEKSTELLLLKADLAVFNGDADLARRSYAQVLKLDVDNHHAWFGLGHIATDREELMAAREALNAALEIRPNFFAALSELATLESLAGNYTKSQALFSTALKQQPDDIIALTGLGLLNLKLGQTEAALNNFLRAGTVAPNYSRPWLYSSIAFYQLGDTPRARDALSQAARLDPRDPLPAVLLSQIESDSLSLTTSIRAAQSAEAKMPYLKSLNQLANTQAGSANLGSSLANAGLESWANYYSISSFNEFWAGSHLFTADRYTGDFNKGSALFKGYLTDPSVFGSTNQLSSLISRPGHYGQIGFQHDDDGTWTQRKVSLSANGLTTGEKPLAYYLAADPAAANAGSGGLKGDSDGGKLTLGLGSRVNEQIRLFGFGTSNSIAARLNSDDYQNADYSLEVGKLALGLAYQPEHNRQLWLKLGDTRQSDRLSGERRIQSIETDFIYSSEVRQSDIQLRESRTLDTGWRYSWGVEYARQTKPAALQLRLPNDDIRYSQSQVLDSRDAYFAINGEFSKRVTAEFGGYLQSQSLQSSTRVSNSGRIASTSTDESSQVELNPRAGLKFALDEHVDLRVVGQQWRRPASASTLLPTDTLGVPLNDWLVSSGGLYERARLQLDAEVSPNLFINLFADSERIEDNDASKSAIVPNLNVSELEKLSNRLDVFAPSERFEGTPLFDEGRLDSMGLAVNLLASDNLSVSAEYSHYDSLQTDGSGNRIPFVPEHFARLSSHFWLKPGWLVGASATYRTDRYSDRGNQDLLEEGTDLAFIARWETSDKQLSTQVSIDQITVDAGSKAENARLSFSLNYRF